MFFSQQLQSRLLQRADMEAALRQAVRRNELQLYFQPLIGLADRRVHGAEALVRWERPGHGLVPPGIFIPLAEQTGAIEAIGTWVLTEACRTLAAWQAQGRAIGHVAVNISGQQLKQPDFPEQVAAILHRTGLAPKHLVLEVTETAFIEDKDASFAKLQRLRELGIRIAVDDFGTGYASMEYLRSLPADTFKIDRLFIKELPDSARDLAIIKSLQALAEQLGLHLIAEGVETAEQAELLARLGVEAVQGYHFSRPLPGPEFHNYVAHTGLPECPTVRLARA
jgi:EAL domain-containing protein (putative c-di-GMP-specific phosphodiesterase class I)